MMIVWYSQGWGACWVVLMRKSNHYGTLVHRVAWTTVSKNFVVVAGRGTISAKRPFQVSLAILHETKMCSSVSVTSSQRGHRTLWRSIPLKSRLDLVGSLSFAVFQVKTFTFNGIRLFHHVGDEIVGGGEDVLMMWDPFNHKKSCVVHSAFPWVNVIC